MIIVDTNYLVEIFVRPTDDTARSRRDQASELLARIERGSVSAILPEVVLHECYYVLVSRLRLMSTERFVLALESILSFPGWSMDTREQRIYLRALDIVEAYPKLELSDAIIAARAEAYEAQLATFDQGLLSLYGGPAWSAD